MEVHPNLKPWRPGQSGTSMVGRLARDLRLARDSRVTWPRFGVLYTAEKQPAVFFATCARLLPNDVRVTVEQSLPGNLPRPLTGT